MADKVKWPAALLFYAIYIVGILAFVAFPSLEKQSFLYALGMGALLGFVCYATFDLTCYALLKDFPLKVVTVDMAWGTALTASVSSLSYLILTWIYA